MARASAARISSRRLQVGEGLVGRLALAWATASSACLFKRGGRTAFAEEQGDIGLLDFAQPERGPS
jgi:hypothetical protein